ncbi:MAG: ECF transporter S component [Deltaproteobacteria bacterium]|nr:ECF transporter S component [Deltaproteobacteria bacterium]
MNAVTIATGEVAFPHILQFSDRRLYVYVSLFVAFDVAVPWLCHIIHPLAGPTLLPLFFFVLLAGMFFGWRAGLLVGVLTPLISYALSGMPLPQILPRIIAEAAVYGLVSGLLRGHFRFGVITSLVGALIAGRLAAFALMALILDLSHSANLAWQATKMGWPGLVFQLLLIPLIVVVLERLWSKHHHAER